MDKIQSRCLQSNGRSVANKKTVYRPDKVYLEKQDQRMDGEGLSWVLF